MNQESMKLILVIEQGSKGIPYPAELDDGRTNHGFQDLKGNTNAVQAIAEVQDCPALRDALVAINAPETPFFTVGCEKSPNQGEGMFWKSGYLEFAFNYAEMVSDAARYFPLFFHFNQATPLREFLAAHQIQFCWELQACRFRKAGVGGFTCAVWINTRGYSTPAECETVWDEAVDHLAGFLVNFKISNLPPFQPMYGPSSNAAATTAR
jgi:hypothetical protein